MDVNELFNQGSALFDADRYDEAIPLFQQAADAGSVEAEIFIPMCYFSLAADTSEAASRSNETAELVRGQQYAVKLCDLAIRSALTFLHNHPNDNDNGNIAGMVISRAFSLQYALIATGLTVAYHLTSTTRTIERTTLNGVTLWEELVNEETNSYVSFCSYNIHDVHLLGDDERTKRIEQNKEKVLQNAVQVATILGYMGREYDALLVRAVVAAEMADCENGIRSMMLSADWFMAMSMQIASQQLDEAAYKEWNDLNETTFTEIVQYQNKYGALLRQMRRDGMRPFLNRFYQSADEVPKIEDCVVYTTYQQENADTEQKAAKGDGFAAFLTVFAQATTQRVIPIVVFPGVFSLLFGGMLREYGVNALSIIWLILTLGLTLIRSLKDSSVAFGKRNSRMFLLIRFGIAIAFSLNFWLGLIPFVVLKFLSKPYK